MILGDTVYSTDEFLTMHYGSNPLKGYLYFIDIVGAYEIWIAHPSNKNWFITTSIENYKNVFKSCRIVLIEKINNDGRRYNM